MIAYGPIMLAFAVLGSAAQPPVEAPPPEPPPVTAPGPESAREAQTEAQAAKVAEHRGLEHPAVFDRLVEIAAAPCGWDPYRAALIALRESAGRPDAVGRNRNGAADTGIWQVNDVHAWKFPALWPRRHLPEVNARIACAVYAEAETVWGWGWHPWCGPPDDLWYGGDPIRSAGCHTE